METANAVKILMIAVPVAIAFFLTLVLLPRLLDMVWRSGFTRKNYKGVPIPVGVGLVFTLAVLGAVAASYLMWPGELQFYGLGFVMAMGVMSLLGFVDDCWGTREITGLKGHFKALFGGRLTTGALKAIGGFVLAVLLGGVTANINEIVINTLVITLSINFINLLDLRPGRAAKGFLLTAVFLIAAGWGRANLVFLLVVTGSLVAYIPYDLKAKTMMGDTGSNALGVALGISAAWLLGLYLKVGYLVVLIALHIFAEKYSLTTVIARNRFLNYLDRLGRK
ncbi:MAG TPA: hypothetical protein VFD15_04090 [Clostridia bacterium]|nr:hypothetical protein [Clostridia bacterium]